MVGENKRREKVPEIVCGFAGGIGGGVGAIVTNPLEVIKTRLQSSDTTKTIKHVGGQRRDYIFKNIKTIAKNEGYRALYKGLPVTLAGVMPARFVYFYSYNTVKSLMNANSPTVHIISESGIN